MRDAAGPLPGRLTMAAKSKSRKSRETTKLSDWEALAKAELKGKPVSTLDWQTPEGIKVKPLYTEADPSVFRVLDRRGVEPLLSRQPQGRADGVVDRLRSGDPSRL